MRSYVVDHQQVWARYLATLTPEQKCDCGCEMRGQCYGGCFGDLVKGGAPRSAQKQG